MESISITKIYQKSAIFRLLAKTFLVVVTIISFDLPAQSVEGTFSQSYLRPESPPSPHAVHWQQGRAFSLLYSNRQAHINETNGESKSSFFEQEVVVDAVFQRQVNPSIGLLTSVSHINADSVYSSEHVGITNDVDRKVRSSLVGLGGSYKIMDALILALNLGYQVSQLDFSDSEVYSRRAYRLTPGIAWKSASFEIALYQARVLGSRSSLASQQHVSEHGLLLSGSQDPRWSWQLWMQHSPQPVCCAFVENNRSVFGGRLFFSMLSGFSQKIVVSPGYRFLSEYQASLRPGTVEDVARHNVFWGATADWEEWKPTVNFSYDMPAKETAPSSFGNTTGSQTSSRSEVEARTFQFGVGLSRSW